MKLENIFFPPCHDYFFFPWHHLVPTYKSTWCGTVRKCRAHFFSGFKLFLGTQDSIQMAWHHGIFLFWWNRIFHFCRVCLLTQKASKFCATENTFIAFDVTVRDWLSAYLRR
jgi:hypothetical protein